jgi:ketosteroid isomerase-like protein
MSDVTQEIQAAANAWMEAWVRADEARLESSLAPDYALIVSASPGQLLSRANWLGTALTRYKATEFKYRDVQVRDLGNGIAVMSSVADFKAEIDGLPRNGPLFLVDVWRRMEGRWRVCARYSASREEAQVAAAAVVSLR